MITKLKEMILNGGLCLSGGSDGADKLFGENALEAGHRVIHWSFLNHRSEGRPENTIVLPAINLLQADSQLNLANVYLQRTFPTRSEYVNNLLRRNWYQVETTDRVYAVCKFDDDYKPIGGTSWAIVMAIHNHVQEIYAFNVSIERWMKFDRKYIDTNMIHKDEWELIDLDDVPRPHGIYTGIGMSELSQIGHDAIVSLYDRDWTND